MLTLNPTGPQWGDQVVDSSTSTLAGNPSPIASAVNDSPMVLRAHGAHFEMRAIYSRLLRTMIFPSPLPGFDDKKLIQFRRILDDFEAHLVLGLLWQASDFISEFALAAAGLPSPEGDSLNSHGLAVKLSATAADLAKTNSRIRNIGIAGFAYSLVERKVVHKTRVDLKGTSVLHQFMLAVGRQSIRAASSTSSVTPGATPTDEILRLKGD